MHLTCLPIVWDFGYIVGDNFEGGFCDLTDEQVEKYSKMFAEPDEDITPEELEPHMQIFGFDMS